MNYSKELSRTLNFVNKVLDSIDKPNLLENSDFEVDEMSMDTWLKVNLIDKKINRIPLSLTITPTGLEIRLDRVSEAYVWADEYLIDSEPLFFNKLKNIFTSYTLVGYYGNSRTYFRFYNQDGSCNGTIKAYEGIVSIFGKRRDRLYLPIY